MPRFGFTYPTVTGETPTVAFRRVLGDFPEMQMWSHYYNGTDLPSWGEAWFNEAPADCLFLISIKHSNVQAIGDRVAQMPEHLRGRVLLFLHHEPDQWRSATDPRSDPDPLTWRQRQKAFLDYSEGKPWEHWVELWVCFTEDRYRTDSDVWEANWGGIVRYEPRIAGVAFDCFNIGRSITRPGSDIFGKPVDFARREGVPLIIREYGQVTPVDSPVDSQAVANQIAENWDWATTEARDVMFGIVWYYNHNNVLRDPSGNRPGRPLTEAVIRQMLAEATMEPDPDHPQYKLGYAAGRASRESEIAALDGQIQQLRTDVVNLQRQLNEAQYTNQDLMNQLNQANAEVDRLNDELTDARNQAATAKAQGRLEAFSETAAWAQNQA